MKIAVAFGLLLMGQYCLAMNNETKSTHTSLLALLDRWAPQPTPEQRAPENTPLNESLLERWMPKAAYELMHNQSQSELQCIRIKLATENK
jgi:hypothetical protein